MPDALDAGFSEAEQNGLPPVGLCVILLRTQTGQEAAELVEMLKTLRHRRVVGLLVDGNEAAAGRTGPSFADALRRVGDTCLKKTVHAGESRGAEGFGDAIELLQADRIDHGFRAIEDATVVELLAHRQSPIGVCPTSNIVLNVFPSMDVHPLERLRQSGVLLSTNTDDPSLLETDLVQECGLSAKQFGWSENTVRLILRQR